MPPSIGGAGEDGAGGGGVAERVGSSETEEERDRS